MPQQYLSKQPEYGYWRPYSSLVQPFPLVEKQKGIIVLHVEKCTPPLLCGMCRVVAGWEESWLRDLLLGSHSELLRPYTGILFFQNLTSRFTLCETILQQNNKNLLSGYLSKGQIMLQGRLKRVNAAFSSSARNVRTVLWSLPLSM